MLVNEKKFSIEVANEVSNEWYGKNWPVVYILSDKKEAYIGETTSITTRMKQHLKIEERKKLTTINIITHDKFNKSAILDVESKLIEYMSADNLYKITNSNSGMRNHDYYNKEKYEKLFQDIWSELRNRKIVQKHLEEIINSDIFKYTPYKRLTEEQYSVAYEIVLDLLIMTQTNQTSTIIVNGEAGTGKTVLAMYLMKLFSDNKVLEFISEDNESILTQFKQAQSKMKDFKIGLVVPMTSLRSTLRKVVGQIDGLNKNMILGPSDVAKDEYDLLIVDESHRLFRRTSLPNYVFFDNVNKQLGLKEEDEPTQLDWILKQSKHQILFYDSLQSIRPSDIRPEDFKKLETRDNFAKYNIQSQLRVKGGNDYLKYIKDVFSENPPLSKKNFDHYELKLFDSITDMKDAIVEKNEKYQLSRMVAGFAWQWKTKKYTFDEAIENGIYDIEIEDQKYIWNTKESNSKGWAIAENSINEIGSIHTIQGYDLNYTGVIIGKDIYFNKKTNRIEINKDNYFDTMGKAKIQSDEELRRYIINIYTVLLSRAIHGTFVYVCDPNLREYLSKYI